MTRKPAKPKAAPAADLSAPLPEPIRSMCVAMLARVGGWAWAEREVDTPDFIEETWKTHARLLNDGSP